MGQNIHNRPSNNWKLRFALESYDMSLISDEEDFNQEVIFSPYLIAQAYGNRLPFYFDINNPISSQGQQLIYKNYNPNNILISQNFYNPKNDKLNCLTEHELCDIGLTGIDNGLVDKMTGETITYYMGLLPDNQKFERLKFDRRLKLFQVTGYTSTNIMFSGFNKTVLYEVVSKQGTEGKYHELYGGFYQGFYRLFGYDYSIFPERMNKGWAVEMVLKPRLINEYGPNINETTLNLIYPKNKNTFFYFGTRAENKFYHHAKGHPISFSGYTRLTTELDRKLQTCTCCNTGDTKSRCIFVYPPESNDGIHDPHLNYGCDSCGGQIQPTMNSSCDDEPQTEKCGWECQTHTCGDITINSIENTCETNPLFDSMSNAFSMLLCGDPKNPSIGVRVLRFTGGCETINVCDDNQNIYSTGYTIDEYCSPPIYDYCENINPDFIEHEHWFLVDAVWERYTWMDEVELCYRGGLRHITNFVTLQSLAHNSSSLITTPFTQSGATEAEKIQIVDLNAQWLIDKKYRIGRLKIYVNGKIHDIIENFEEIIPRALNTDKERQLGVPFNISWGGGTQGLRENLTMSSVDLPFGPYIQDPESFPKNDFIGTSLEGMETNILIEKHFAGTFEGAVSQFRMYITPLSAPEIKHNFKLLKDNFRMFNPDCPNCDTTECLNNDFTFELIPLTETLPFMLGREFVFDERDNNYLIRNNFSLLKQSKTVVKVKKRVTPTPTKSKINQPTLTPTPTLTQTPTPSNTSLTKRYWDDDGWWGNQLNTPQCVGYSWAHWIEDGPVPHDGIPPIIKPYDIYYNAQKIDEWPGENYAGTSVRAAAKYLKNIGAISSYYWAFDLNTLIKTVMELGPVVVGTNWYYNMFYPSSTGIIKASGRNAGGHAYVINGVDTKTKLFRIKNSWGKNWGDNGHAYISFTDMSKLIKENGEICIAVENIF